MSAHDTFMSAEDFSAWLQSLLSASRKVKKCVLRKSGRRRAALSAPERNAIFEKTAGRCHVCGGEIDGPWEADHVFSHALGGKHAIANYLPAHQICNNYRWHYSAEEVQWILKLGVWLRTRIIKKERVGLEAAGQFIHYEQRRHKRRGSNGKQSLR